MNLMPEMLLKNVGMGQDKSKLEEILQLISFIGNRSVIKNKKNT